MTNTDKIIEEFDKKLQNDLFYGGFGVDTEKVRDFIREALKQQRDGFVEDLKKETHERQYEEIYKWAKGWNQGIDKAIAVIKHE